MAARTWDIIYFTFYMYSRRKWKHIFRYSLSIAWRITVSFMKEFPQQNCEHLSFEEETLGS